MTLNYIIDSSRDRYQDLPAVGMAMEEPISYQELHERICALGARFLQEGVEKGDRVAILAENSHHWGTVYLAAVRIGAVGVPILPDLPQADVQHILAEMQPRLLFTTQRQVEKVYEMRSGIPQKIVTLDDYRGVEGLPQVDAFSPYLDEALNKYRVQAADGVLPGFPEVAEDDLASILYTSGTSGFSKAVMLSHKNLTSNAYAASNLMDLKPGNTFLSILPMSHTYEFTTGFILPLLMGSRIAYAGKTPTPAILQNLCAHEKPSVIFAVPLVLEKIYKKRVLPKIANSGLLTLLYKFGPGRKLVNKGVGKKLIDFFGGNLSLMGIGGAALNPEVEKFLIESRFPYLVGYGLTESSPLIAGGPFGDSTITLGSSGKPIPGVEVRIVNPHPETGIGEVHALGPNIMQGYHNDVETTAEVIAPEGWLATGDLGVLDEEGNLHIKGRCKNIIVLASGENVYPEAIEHKLNSYHWVVESLVVESEGKLHGWIYPDYEYIDGETAGQSRIQRRGYVEGLLEAMRKEVNVQLPSTSRLNGVFERREPFIKTATHKIKRYLYDQQANIG
jgi:long-chain acyl-CoA synthetase